MRDITVIKSHKRFSKINLKEVWKYRELFWVLSLREFKVRYKQTVIGALWAIIRPLLTMIVFTILFGQIAKIQTGGIPYPIFSYSGLILWTFFSSAVSQSSMSLVVNTRLITKVFFPRIIIPASTTIVCLIDYFIAFIIVFGLMIYYNFPLTPSILFVPVILFFTLMLSMGFGLWFSALNVQYRDVQYALPFFTQTLLYITPVIYPAAIAGKYKWLLFLNPLSGLVEAHRAVILGNLNINWHLFITSIVLNLLIFITGYIYFKGVEKKFADII